MIQEVSLPTYETLLTEAIRSLSVDSGVVSSPVAADGNTLSDATKNWAVNIHRNRLVKIIRGKGIGQLFVIQGNSSNTLVIRGSWPQAIGTGAAYIILERIEYGGAVYENVNVAIGDGVRRFEQLPKKLNDVVIYVETNDQVFGNQANQRFPISSGSAMGFTRVDISTLYFRNRNAGQNGIVYILGVEE